MESPLHSSPQLDKLVALDKVIHERVRLGIMAALSVSQELTFQEIKQMLKVTDGNLSVHLRSLEKHDYVEAEKNFIGRKPQSCYRLSATGRSAFRKYISQMENLICDLHLD